MSVSPTTRWLLSTLEAPSFDAHRPQCHISEHETGRPAGVCQADSFREDLYTSCPPIDTDTSADELAACDTRTGSSSLMIGVNRQAIYRAYGCQLVINTADTKRRRRGVLSGDGQLYAHRQWRIAPLVNLDMKRSMTVIEAFFHERLASAGYLVRMSDDV